MVPVSFVSACSAACRGRMDTIMITKADINLNNVTLSAVAGEPSQFVRDGLPQIAFSGRSNVGKSSLINTLLGRRALARVSSSPGKTITVNYYSIDKKFYFVDLPGYGFAKRSPAERDRLSRLGDGYYADRGPVLTVQLIDIKVGPTSDDLMMIDFLRQTGMEYIIAATKCDKLGSNALKNALAELQPFCSEIVPFSSLKGTGREQLWSCLIKAANGSR